MADTDDPAGSSEQVDTGAPENGKPDDKPADEQGDELATMRKALERANAQAKQLRGELKELRPQAERARELEDKSKTETERLTDALAELRTQAESATSQLDKLRVALANAPDGLDLQRIEALASRLQGSTVEELQADAEELFAQLAPPAANGPAGGRTPVEQLRPGSLPKPADAPLPEQILAAEQAGDLVKARELKALQLIQLHEKQQ